MVPILTYCITKTRLSHLEHVFVRFHRPQASGKLHCSCGQKLWLALQQSLFLSIATCATGSNCRISLWKTASWPPGQHKQDSIGQHELLDVDAARSSSIWLQKWYGDTWKVDTWWPNYRVPVVNIECMIINVPRFFAVKWYRRNKMQLFLLLKRVRVYVSLWTLAIVPEPLPLLVCCCIHIHALCTSFRSSI